jgi:heme/copper-type cytochrome/quinol oxidase subunit 2
MTQIWMLVIVIAMVVFIILQFFWNKGNKAKKQTEEPKPKTENSEGPQ